MILTYGFNIQLTVSLITASIAMFLGFLVYIHDSNKGASNLLFFYTSATFAVWSLVNYLSLVIIDDRALLLIRLILCLGVIQLVLFLMFLVSFPKDDFRIKQKTFYSIIISLFAVCGFVFTPYVFDGVKMGLDGIYPVPGKLIPVFGAILAYLVFSAVVLIVVKYYRSEGVAKKQWMAISMGFGVSFVLLFFLVFVTVAMFQVTTYVPYAPAFTLPIFLGAAYAILRHKMFNIKVISTEIITFVLLMVGFIQLIIAYDTLSMLLSLAVIMFILITGTELIRSVIKEVEQKNKLQTLSDELTSANTKLKDLDRARAEFISIASHQLRTPPATIKWYLAAIVAGDFGKVGDKALEAIKKAETTNNTQIMLIDDLLNVSRIERGRMEFLFEDVDMAEMVKRVTEQLGPLARIKNLKLSFQKSGSKIPTIKADKEKIQQVINNLIDNAIKYSGRGEILVKIYKQQDNIIIKVIDTGKGMSSEELEGIFQKYGRGKDSIKHSAGLGLGLYVARVILEHHHGTISAQSKGEGLGSTFTVTLPIHTDLADEGELDLTKQ